jgi:excisionase family DNA binding protein
LKGEIFAAFLIYCKMMNPFESIEARLNSIETLLIDLKFPSKSIADPVKNELLTIRQAAEMLSVSVPTIYGYVHQRAIPCMKRRGRLYFSKTELLAWVQSGKRSTLDEIKANSLNSLG